jgi:hypothetical protein
MSSMGSCKTKNEIQTDEDISYFTPEYYHQINVCLAYPGGAGCNALCKKEMPWTGITRAELKHWDRLQHFLNNIKASFPDPKWTKEADSIVNTWETNSDKILTKYFKETQLRSGGFNVTDYYNATASGLTLERLGFTDLKEWVRFQDEIQYASGFIDSLPLWGIVVCAFMMTLNGGF